MESNKVDMFILANGKYFESIITILAAIQVRIGMNVRWFGLAKLPDYLVRF